MKILFTASPRSLEIKNYKNNFIKIFNTLKKKGINLSKSVIEVNPKKLYQINNSEIIKHYKETISNLKKADIVVVEVSTNSLSMGYIINKAIELSKPILILYTQGYNPFFLLGIENDNLVCSEYNFNNIDDVIEEAFDYFTDKQDKRFNIMLSPQIVSFLNDLSKKDKVSKAQIVRRAITTMM